MNNLKLFYTVLFCTIFSLCFIACDKDDEAFEGPISFYIDGLEYTSYDYKNFEVSNTNQKIFDELVIPSTVTYNGKTYNVSEIGVGAFMFDEFTSLTISNGIKTIRNNAFTHCEKITTITIPNSVREIGISPFSGNKLANIVVEPGNRVYDSRDNCNAIIETRTNTLVQGCKNTIIPNTVINIGERAFSGLDNLTKITIPNSVTSIGYEAFRNTGLISLTIPNSVTKIEEGVFAGCDALRSIYLLSIKPITAEYNLTNDRIYKSCTLYVPQGSLAAYKSAEGWKEFENIVEFDPSTL